jgi:hypothetical protein
VVDSDMTPIAHLSQIDASSAALRTIFPDVFSQNPFCATYFFSTGKKSKQKSPLAKLCSSSNDL